MNRPRWNNKLLAQLKTMYEAGIASGDTKSYLIMEIARKLDFPQNMVQYQIAKLHGKMNTKWTQEEISIIKTITLSNFKRENVEKLVPLLPGRTYKQIRSKIYYCCGIKMDRVTSKKPREDDTDSNKRTLDQVMIGEDSIYHKAAKLIGGEYYGGIIIKNGRQLTGKETLELLARARDNA